MSLPNQPFILIDNNAEISQHISKYKISVSEACKAVMSHSFCNFFSTIVIFYLIFHNLSGCFFIKMMDELISTGNHL